MLRDLRYAFRTLLKTPAFSAVAILTLALGIAANTAIFSAVDAVLLHPLPFPRPSELVDISKTMPSFGLFQSVSSALDFQDYRSNAQAFSGMAAIETGQFNLTGAGQPERVPGMRVSASLFSVLGVQPILGRTFAGEEEQWGRHKAALLSEPFWRSHFGGDRKILGRQITLDGESYTVAGVVPPMLAFLSGSQIWLPLAYSPEQLNPKQRGHQNLFVIARLKPGMSLEQARTDLKRVSAHMAGAIPDWYPKDWSIEAVPLAVKVSGPVRTPLMVLLGAVALVLLIACVNVANLSLARASARQKEITIRTALGAGRLQIVRQLLIESAAIAIAAGILGLTASVWVLDLFERFGPRGLLRGQHLESNILIAGFTLTVSLLAALLFGVAPAIAMTRVNLNDALKESSRGAAGSSGKQRLRSALVAAEVALSLTLLISAGLLIRSFQRLQTASPGFDAQHVAVFQVSLPVLEYREPAQVASFYQQFMQRLASIPGVSSAGAVDSLPFSGSNRGGSFSIVGRPWGPGEAVPDIPHRQIMPGYFHAMRIPLLQGRAFSEQDHLASAKVAVVDEPFVKRFFPKENPIGKVLGGGPDGLEYAIVGVVGAVKHNNLAVAPEPTIYYPSLQMISRPQAIVLRTTGGDPLSVMPAVRRELGALNRNLPLYRVSTMEALLSNSLARTRFATTLLAVFAALALLLASIGIYGVISYLVAQRAPEIGIRMALGARPGDAVRLVLSQGAMPILTGMAVGLAAALAVTRALSTLLYDVSPTDPLTFGLLPLFLAAVALAATYFPARRSAKVDPMVALRYE